MKKNHKIIITSVSEVDKMKKERLICGLVLIMMMNWMIHGELGAVIYFGAVMTGLLVYYRSICLEQIFESALLRFVLILSVSLCFSQEMKLFDACAWLMMSVTSSAYTQRIQKSDAAFLNQLSIFNMLLMPVMLILVLCCMNGSEISCFILMSVLSFYQPSGLPLCNPLDSFEVSKPAIK